MNINLEVQNYANDISDVTDRLRGEIGFYYSRNSQGQLEPTRFESGKISSADISSGDRNDQLIFPKYNHVINFYGTEEQFRDQLQWREFVNETCIVNRVLEDHTFQDRPFDVQNNIYANYHERMYEDYSKVYDTNHLVNYNIVNYRFNNNNAMLRELAMIETPFDAPTDEPPNSNQTVARLIQEYPDRIENFNGTLFNLDRKQRHVFHFPDASLVWGTTYQTFPYALITSISPNFHSLSILHRSLQDHDTEKFLFQYIRDNNLFRNLEFLSDDEYQFPDDPTSGPSLVKAHNLTDMIINYDASEFVEKEDELFLFKETDLTANDISNRFVNQINRLQFISSYRNIIKQSEKDYNNLINCEPSKVFRVGYKIEKYYLNDETTPVQTNYISSDGLATLVDTQLKYGDQYIYKVYELLGVLGCAYSYSDLYVTNEDGELESSDGTVRAYGDSDTTKKYRARVKVSVNPSFQILEKIIGEFSRGFSDRPSVVPEVAFYNESNKRNNIMIFFKTNLSAQYDVGYDFIPISNEDRKIQSQLDLARDSLYGTIFSPDYFIGRYEIYRMDEPPTNISQFKDNFLVEVDQTTDILSPPLNVLGERTMINVDYPNASFEDVVLPNKKYYYMFRSLTYHGTPSNPTDIFEVELLEDSDETKITVKEYKIPVINLNSPKKSCKRIIKIEPNFSQLIFRDDEYDTLQAAPNAIGFPQDRLFNGNGVGKKFKIRITSKHTGKKLDINLTFKLKKSNFPS
jgi:hypothetical protein